jgi:hypothetical protein
MKAGDIICCKEDYIIKRSLSFTNDRKWFTKNKEYIVYFKVLTNRFYLIDDEGDENDVVINEKFDSFFCTKNEYRKLKINKLNKLNNI